jgi:hypothetical protein
MKPDERPGSLPSPEAVRNALVRMAMRSRDSISSTSFGSRCGRGAEVGRVGFRLIDVADGAVVCCFRCRRNVSKNRVNGAVTAITRVVGMLEIGAS